jgi:hypothetical protein
VELGLVVGDSDGVGRLVTAHPSRLGAYELIELSAHGIGERANAGGVALQGVRVVHFDRHF